MKLCVIHPKACSSSANNLAEEIGAVAINPYDVGRDNFREYDLVFNYGVSANIRANLLINPSKSVQLCLDKVKTFDCLKAVGANIPDYRIAKKDVPKTWDTVVCRQSRTGRRAEGLDYAYQYKNDPIPDAVFYTEFFWHEYEFRVMVFKGKVYARYLKQERDGEWCLDLLERKHFKQIDEHCVKAANALGIDYVGFDVVAREGMEEFVILEANSGAILTEESINVIKKYLKGLK